MEIYQIAPLSSSVNNLAPRALYFDFSPTRGTYRSCLPAHPVSNVLHTCIKIHTFTWSTPFSEYGSQTYSMAQSRLCAGFGKFAYKEDKALQKQRMKNWWFRKVVKMMFSLFFSIFASPWGNVPLFASNPHTQHLPVSHAATISNGVNLRILPLGDSITYGAGSSDGNGYRLALQNMLSGNNVQYVGSQHSGSMANNSNEGHAELWSARLPNSQISAWNSCRMWYYSWLEQMIWTYPQIQLRHLIASVAWSMSL
jgi:hypothetical protein